MMKRFLLPGLLAGLALVGLASVPVKADRIDKAAKPSADKLVEQLGSDSFNVRKKAYEQLEALGAAALPALQKATKSEDTEVRKKATELVAKIEKQEAVAKALAPTQVHLVYKNTPVKDAVADLKKKTGYLIVLHDPDNKLKDKKVTLDTGKVTFWEALEKFCDAAGLVEGDPNADRNAGGGVIGFPGGGIRPVPMPLPAVPPGGGKVLPPVKKPAKDQPADKKGEKETPPDKGQTDPAVSKEEAAAAAKKKVTEEEAKKAAALESGFKAE